MFLRVKKSSGREYLQIVENKRDGKTTRQRVIGTIGRMDELAGRGQIDQLLRSLAKYSDRALLLLAGAGDPESEVKKVGPVLVFERLWEQSGIGDIIRGFLKDRRYRFNVERAVFVTVLHRLMNSGSDRQAERWMGGYRIAGAGSLDLQHFYRAMGWLGSPLKDQPLETGFSPRCVKDVLEEEIFRRRRDLFTGIDLVFFDTTSIYFEGDGGETIGQYGHSKDHRSDRKQMVVGMVLDNEGYPICCEMWPGNTTDVTTLKVLTRQMKERFGIEQICVVSDRGMISKKALKALKKEGIHYILGVRMRRNLDMTAELLESGTWVEIHGSRQRHKDPSPLRVKEKTVNGQRYVICENPEEKKADADIRAKILMSLAEKLRQGDNALVGNKGYRRFLRVEGDSHFVIDEKKVLNDARFDGKWVLTTDMDLPMADVALKYKQLILVEMIFRDMKSVLDTRPIFHKCDETIRGHVFCSFLALVLRKELDRMLERAGHRFEWEDIKRDLKALVDTTITEHDKTISVRSRAEGCCGKVFASVGVALPVAIKES
ncbi:MAG: IS1634 family transposase [Candidatus Melainabacteria bacterium]|nr:IS1634 family transposase [Candidatus Melainabacteria bacterium]